MNIENLENEVWMTHPKYDWMAASNLGRIKSIERDIYKKDGKPYHCQEQLIKLSPTDGGYLKFDIWKDGKREDQPKAHRFVWECFNQQIIPKGCSKLQINHIDENKTNNRIENLELCTPQYNSEYSLAKQVAQYNLNGNLVKIWKSMHQAEREGGFTHQCIWSCCNGKRKTHKGFIWRYIDE